MKKLLMILPLMVLMVASVLALGTSYSLRESSTETKDVNVCSNGISGAGAISFGYSYGRTVYYLEQKNGAWSERTQIGMTRYAWNPVHVYYDNTAGTLTIPELALTVSVVNLK